MKKILLITEIYPSPHGTGNETPICHYFAKEWKEMGYDVKVIHINYILPRIYKWVGKLLSRLYPTNTWSVNFMNTSGKSENYEIDTIPITYIPIIRPLPRYKVPKCLNGLAYKKVEHLLHVDNYIPDIIIGHWTSPLYFISKLKAIFPKVRTGLVLHQNPIFSNDMRILYDTLDAIGFRNNAIQESFECLYGKHDNEFICYSGVPEAYLSPVPKTFNSTISRFVYVGKLIELKRIENSIIALNRIYEGKNFHFDIVGDGVCRTELERLTDELNLNEKITFHGNVPRNKAQEIVNHAECFVMVSDHEAFGLVYLEAMAKGLITIATKGQGADGFIVDGNNGFLCPPKDVDALCETLRKVKSMNSDELYRMSSAALTTASEMTDRKVAEKYIESIIRK